MRPVEGRNMPFYRQEVIDQYRLSMPRAERRHPWLRHALDLYALVDASVADALAASGREAACRAGCSACCRQSIPVTFLEVAVLQWFIREEMPPGRLQVLRDRPENAGDGERSACRFLLGGSCAVYQARPVACRRYIIFGVPCAAGEDPTLTRPGDVLAPSRDALNAAYALTLPYYAALGESIPEENGAFAFMAPRTTLLSSVSGAILTS